MTTIIIVEIMAIITAMTITIMNTTVKPITMTMTIIITTIPSLKEVQKVAQKSNHECPKSPIFHRETSTNPVGGDIEVYYL